MIEEINIKKRVTVSELEDGSFIIKTEFPSTASRTGTDISETVANYDEFTKVLELVCDGLSARHEDFLKEQLNEKR